MALNRDILVKYLNKHNHTIAFSVSANLRLTGSLLVYIHATNSLILILSLSFRPFDNCQSELFDCSVLSLLYLFCVYTRIFVCVFRMSFFGFCIEMSIEIYTTSTMSERENLSKFECWHLYLRQCEIVWMDGLFADKIICGLCTWMNEYGTCWTRLGRFVHSSWEYVRFSARTYHDCSFCFALIEVSKQLIRFSDLIYGRHCLELTALFPSG